MYRVCVTCCGETVLKCDGTLLPAVCMGPVQAQKCAHGKTGLATQRHRSPVNLSHLVSACAHCPPPICDLWATPSGQKVVTAFWTGAKRNRSNKMVKSGRSICFFSVLFCSVYLSIPTVHTFMYSFLHTMSVPQIISPSQYMCTREFMFPLYSCLR